MSRDCTSPSTARISISVTDFHEIGRDRGCSRAEIELIDTGNGKVSQSGINAPIVVRAEVYLEFFVHARDGGEYAYMPIGIGFKSLAGIESKMATEQHCNEGDDRDPLGNAAFPMRHVVAKGNTTQLTLFDANPGPGKFEFSLIIQRSDGSLSIVDPQIHNSGVMA